VHCFKEHKQTLLQFSESSVLNAKMKYNFQGRWLQVQG